MSLVVTGAAGFIGRSLVQRLLTDGHDVVAIDKRPDLPPGARPLVADLSIPEPRVAAALTSARIVWHLAARSGVRVAGPDAEIARHLDNVVATRNVLAATPNEVRVVVTSSSSVYGGSLRAGINRPCAENDPLAPRGGYARSKVEVEALCHARRRNGGKVSIARPFTVAGEGQREDMAIALWIRAALADQPLRILGSLSRTRDITDVRHVVEGLRRMGDMDKDVTVNLGTGIGHTLGSIATEVRAALGSSSEVILQDASPEEVPATLADVTRCRVELGFVPTTDLRALITRQVGSVVGAGRAL